MFPTRPSTSRYHPRRRAQHESTRTQSRSSSDHDFRHTFVIRGLSSPGDIGNLFPKVSRLSHEPSSQLVEPANVPTHTR
ncbi:hypothetical protein J6590_044334 [Homalodisca vitripennis]|nr:hypothetical protein J6590_044334 [Homalodisca vitripennis]